MALLSAEEARRAILSVELSLPLETVELGSSHRRVLGEDVQAADDVPPFDNSAMDGYALRSSDTKGATRDHPVHLALRGEIPAGGSPAAPIPEASAIRIMTGAPIPPGADAVLEQELAEVANGTVEVPVEVETGRNLRRRGDDVRSGTTVLRSGRLIDAAALGILASIGRTSIRVFKRPRVGILATGNELVEPDEPLAAGKIRNSNAYALWALVRETGCEGIQLGITPDDRTVLLERMSDGLRCDALITSGGVSVGKHDLVLKTLEEAGVEIRFWKVNIKPGMPLAFGLYESGKDGRKVPVFALPGNPVSAMVTYLQFVHPALRKLMGFSEPDERLHVRARIEHALRKADRKRHFVRGILRNEGGEFFVRTTGSQSSAVLSSLVAANCLIIVPEEARDLEAGSEVEVEVLASNPVLPPQENRTESP